MKKSTAQIYAFAFVVFAALAVFMYNVNFLDLRTPSVSSVFHIAEGEVLKIEIENEYGTILLEKKSDRYWITAPVLVPAQTFAIEKILNTLRFHGKREEQTLTGDFKKRYGFEKPFAQIRVQTASSATSVLIGESKIDGAERFVMISGNSQLYSLPLPDATLFAGSYTDFRVRQLLTRAPSSGDLLEVFYENESRGIFKIGDENFKTEVVFGRRKISLETLMSFLVRADYSYWRKMDEVTALHRFGLLEPDLALRLEQQGVKAEVSFSVFDGKCFSTLDLPDQVVQLSESSCGELKKILAEER